MMVKVAQAVYTSVLESKLTSKCGVARNFHYREVMPARLFTDMFSLPLNFEPERTLLCQEYHSAWQFLSFAI